MSTEIKSSPASPKPRRRPEPKRTGQTAEGVFQNLVEAILNGELALGMPLREAQLAREWNVSRTPMREAVRRAAEAGFLHLRHNKTALVRRLTSEDVVAIYDLREALELLALARAWPHLTKEILQELRELELRAKPGENADWEQQCLKFDLQLHGCWAEHCQNSWLKSDLERHFQFLQIFQRWMGRNPDHLRRAYKEHSGLLRALEKGNKELAEKRLREHIRASMHIVNQMLP